MAIPSTNKILAPLLLYLETGGPRSPQEVLDHICKEFGTTSDERNMRNASGTNTKIRNRVVWAKVTLKQAGLLRVLPEGGWEITDLGAEKLRSGFRPNVSNVKSLRKHDPEAAREGERAEGGHDAHSDSPEAGQAARALGADAEAGADADQTPYERIDAAIGEMREGVLDDILERARHCDPHYFERIVLDLLERMGYGKGSHVGGSGDRGIDGVLVGDSLGLDVLYVQAKRSSSTISSGTMRAFVGALDPMKSKRGVFITTSDFSDEAQLVVRETRNQIVAINGRRLAELMYEHNVGCEEEGRAVIKRVDDDYFQG